MTATASSRQETAGPKVEAYVRRCLSYLDDLPIDEQTSLEPSGQVDGTVGRLPRCRGEVGGQQDRSDRSHGHQRLRVDRLKA